MDSADVGAAVVVCTEKPEYPNNNRDVLEAARRHPGRLIAFPDVDSAWGPNYRQPGGAERLAALVSATAVKGITHYPDHRDYDRTYWESGDGLEFFACANALGLAISIPVYAPEHRSLQRLASSLPNITFLCHHLAGVRRLSGAPPSHLDLILESARCPNIWIKVSGFHYLDRDVTTRESTRWFAAMYDAFGAHRLIWGSDYPVGLKSTSYGESVGTLETRFPFISAADRANILGGNLCRLLSITATLVPRNR